MREIVLDTETTGMDPLEGDRIVEIGCVELVNQVPTGKTYHQYINPERDMPPEAEAVHGITEAFLKDKPVFAEIYTDFTEFLKDGIIVAHNAPFDMKFINYELRQVGHKEIPKTDVIDSLMIARKKFPGSPASLDALCRRYDIGLEGRELHGALLDAQLLADVYLELMGGRQHGLGLTDNKNRDSKDGGNISKAKKPLRAIRSHVISDEESAAHQAMCKELSDALWGNFEDQKEKEAS